MAERPGLAEPGGPPPRAAVVGDVFVDVMARVAGLPAWDSDTEAEYVKVQPGGSALNQARNLQGLGTEVVFFGAVGDDAFGKMLTDHVTGQGFSLDHLKVFGGVPSSVCIVLTGKKDRAFVSCYSTTDAYSTADLEARSEALAGCTHLHIGGYFNLKGLQNAEMTALVRRCRDRGMTISLNTQYDAAEQWCGKDGHLKELMPLVDLLFVNATEAERLAAALLPPEQSPSPEALCRAYPAMTAVVTRGGEGADVLREGRPALAVPTSPLETVVDATGAGDAFLAGFLAAWLPQPGGAGAGPEALEAAARRGHAAARVCIGRQGACVEPVRSADIE